MDVNPEMEEESFKDIDDYDGTVAFDNFISKEPVKDIHIEKIKPDSDVEEKLQVLSLDDKDILKIL